MTRASLPPTGPDFLFAPGLGPGSHCGRFKSLCRVRRNELLRLQHEGTASVEIDAPVRVRSGACGDIDREFERVRLAHARVGIARCGTSRRSVNSVRKICALARSLAAAFDQHARKTSREDWSSAAATASSVADGSPWGKLPQGLAALSRQRLSVRKRGQSLCE